MSLIRRSTLPSGIKVITEEVPDMESSSIGIWVRTGSRDETPEVNGVSHFIEHLLFKGTERRTALDISREIESVGGVLNAFTGREYTCFYAKVLNKDLPLAVDLLSDMVLNSKFAPEEIEREKQVVLHEIKMVEDTPDDLVHDLFAERFWPGHPLGRPILGTSETMAAMTRDQITGYFSKRYRPENIFITAAGGLGHNEVKRHASAAFRGVKKAGHKARAARPRPRRGTELFDRKVGQVHLCLGVPVPPQSDPDRYAVFLLSTILGGGMSSRLFQEIREKRGLAYSVYSYLSLYKDTGALTVYAGTSKKSFAEVVDLVLAEFARLRKGVGREELGHAKEQLKGGMLLGLETSDSRMSKLARDEIYFGRPVRISAMVKDIDRVGPEDMSRVARKLLLARRATLVTVGKVTAKGLPAVLTKG